MQDSFAALADVERGRGEQCQCMATGRRHVACVVHVACCAVSFSPGVCAFGGGPLRLRRRLELPRLRPSVRRAARAASSSRAARRYVNFLAFLSADACWSVLCCSTWGRARCCWEGCSVCGPRERFLCWDHMSGQSGEVHCLVTSFLYHKCMRCVFMLDMHCVSGSGHKGRCPEAQVRRACPTCSCTQALTSKAGVALCCRVVSALSCLVLLCLRLAVFNNFCLKLFF